MLHYDNDPSHNAMFIKEYISKISFQKVTLCDLDILSTIKTQFEGKEFELENELFEEHEIFFKGKSKEFYISLLHEWERRLHRYIDLKGDYVE